MPSGCPYAGEWLLENRLFLYRSDGTQLIEGDAPRFTVTWKRTNGVESIGFDAGHLASAFDIDVEAVFEANRNGALRCLGTNDAVSRRRARATRFVFKLGGRTCAIVADVA